MNFNTSISIFPKLLALENCKIVLRSPWKVLEFYSNFPVWTLKLIMQVLISLHSCAGWYRFLPHWIMISEILWWDRYSLLAYQIAHSISGATLFFVSPAKHGWHRGIMTLSLRHRCPLPVSYKFRQNQPLITWRTSFSEIDNVAYQTKLKEG